MEYRPGKKGGKRDALMRRAEDLLTAGDKRLTRNVRILLPKERYWDILDTEEMKVDLLDKIMFRDTDEGEIQKASQGNNEV